MGKHSSAVTRSNPSNNNRRPVYITAVGLLVLAIGGVFVVRSFGSEAGADGLGGKACSDPTQIKLSTAPELQPALETATKSLAVKGGKDGIPCLQFEITGASPYKVAQDLASGADGRPDLWIPDSSLWVSQADDGETVPSIAVPSVASSPMVLVGRSSNFADTSSWLRAFGGGVEPALLDPLGTSPGALALLAIQAERQKTSASDTETSAVVVPLAQHLGSMPKPFTDVNALFGRAAQDDSKVIVPASEQSFVKFQEEHPESELKAVMPATGTLSLDYPIVVAGKGDTNKATEAGKALGAEMIGDAAGQARDQAGFRDQLLSQLTGGRGVGDIDQLPKPNAESIDRTLGTWSRLSLSTHSLAVIDISGSMAEKVGNKTRMQLTIEAASGGLSLFPDTAKLGLWTFSSNITKDHADYNKLVPIKALDAKQRKTIGNVLKAQKPIPNGGTGLYETAIAAVRAVRAEYDANAVNSVLLFTDGKNDDPGSGDLEATIRSLQSLNDPDRPVRIIALGMGPDANPNELSRLAKATGGRSYVAADPGKLREVFIDALQNR